MITSLVKELKQANQDSEFYPTTNEILQVLGESVKNSVEQQYRRETTVLDIGAGNGKCLDYFRKLQTPRGDKIFQRSYGIEKSQILINLWDKNHMILGVDFHKTTLLDKTIDVIYCNPPYSEMSVWLSKIIREAPSGCLVYFLTPHRWKTDRAITEALEGRRNELEIVGSFSFEDAEDRKARAKVDLVKIKMVERYEDGDPFTSFFNENFKYPEKEEHIFFEEEVEENKLVTGQNLIEVLVSIHDVEMEKLIKNFSAICELDHDLLKEFEITKAGLVESLKQKISNLKKRYWTRLFDGLDKIHERLTKDSRQKIVERMQANTGIEFNRENAYSVVMWVVKHANDYFDSQFVDTYEKMVNFANVENYKSNKRVFTDRQFSYHYEGAEKPSHYKLKVGNRIVLERCGGLRKTEWSYDRGLEERAADFIGDLMVIGNNLGFHPIDKKPKRGEWDDNGAREFRCKYKGEEKVLFEVRCFYNGNIHVRFLPEFVHSLNIQFGRLRGWIYSGGEAAKEVDIPQDQAEEYFNLDFKLGANQLLLQ